MARLLEITHWCCANAAFHRRVRRRLQPTKRARIRSDYVGERYMFFLHRDEWYFPANGDYVVTWGQFGRLIVDTASSAPVTYSDGARTPVPFAAGMSPQQFSDAVIAEVDEQYH